MVARWRFPMCGRSSWVLADRGRRPDSVARPDRVGLARRSSVTNVVAAHTRGVPDVDARAERDPEAAACTTAFWDGHLDLGGFGLGDQRAPARHRLAAEQIERATDQAHHYSGGPVRETTVAAPSVLGWPDDSANDGRSSPTRPVVPTAKAAPYVGLTLRRRGRPGPWSSPPDHASGAAVGVDQAAGGARRVDPPARGVPPPPHGRRGHATPRPRSLASPASSSSGPDRPDPGQPLNTATRRHSPDPSSSQRRGPGPGRPQDRPGLRAFRASARPRTAPSWTKVKERPDPATRAAVVRREPSCHQRPIIYGLTNR